jgi:hypothetical protein
MLNFAKNRAVGCYKMRENEDWWNLSRDIMTKRFWTVVLIIAGIKGLVFILDPLPQFYGGDSTSYLNTKIGVWIPLDRSFFYGLLIRVIENCSHSLTPLILLQVTVSSVACLLLYYCAKEILCLPYGLSLVLTVLFAADPMQLLYERQIMAETISTFHLVVALTLSLSYLKRHRAWKCALIPVFGLLSTAFRLNAYPVAWFLCLGIPLFAFLRHLFHDCGRRDIYRLAGHCVLGVACFVSVLSLYTNYYGRLTDREPAVTYTQGFFMLSGLWDVVIPEDATDPRLAQIIASQQALLPGQNPALERNAQRFGAEGLICRWETTRVEGPPSRHDEIARQTAWNAIRRAPAQVLRSAMSNYREYFSDMPARIYDIYERFMPISDKERQWLKEHFNLTVTRDWKDRSTLTKQFLFQFRWWCYVLLLSPFLGIVATSLLWNSVRFIPLAFLTIAGVLAFLPGCVFVVTNARLLHPLSFGAFLTLGVIAHSLGRLFLQHKSSAWQG